MAAAWSSWRCPGIFRGRVCGRQLALVRLAPGAAVQVKCERCGRITTLAMGEAVVRVA
jgi:hypothetical protein